MHQDAEFVIFGVSLTREDGKIVIALRDQSMTVSKSTVPVQHVIIQLPGSDHSLAATGPRPIPINLSMTMSFFPILSKFQVPGPAQAHAVMPTDRSVWQRQCSPSQRRAMPSTLVAQRALSSLDPSDRAMIRLPVPAPLPGRSRGRPRPSGPFRKTLLVSKPIARLGLPFR